MHHTVHLHFRPSYRRQSQLDETIGEEIIDAKIVEPEMKIEIGVEIE